MLQCFSSICVNSDSSHGMKTPQPSLSHNVMVKVKAAEKLGCLSPVVTPMSVSEGWMIGWGVYIFRYPAEIM